MNQENVMNFRTILLTMLGLGYVRDAYATEEMSANLRGTNSRTLSPTTSSPTLLPTQMPTINTASFPEVVQITQAQINTVIGKLEAARAATVPFAADMQATEWDAELAADLYTFSKEVNANWYFETCDMTGPKRTSNSSYCGFNTMEIEPFKTKYPGFGFVTHDTFMSPSLLGFNFGFRLNQKHCVNFSKCSSDEFTNFETCGSPLVAVPGQTCSWATQYYPRLMMASLNKIACTTFKVHGPNAPKEQPWSYFCYGNYTQPLNDKPFEVGAHCSQCPEDAPVCVHNLCTPKAPAKGRRLLM
jgi:hypothetical protein